MPFTIRAAFLMHMYQGADDMREPELYPSPERLYRALVSAAYGPCGFESGELGRPDSLSDEAIRSALAWLESNPPDAIRLPSYVPRKESSVIVYRDRGTFPKNSKNAKSVPKNARPVARSVVGKTALVRTVYDPTEKGDLVWQWGVSPDSRIVDTLDALCAEVPYLGEACCPVRIEATGDVPEYPMPYSIIRRDVDALDRYARLTALKFRTPISGHLRELQEGHKNIRIQELTASRKNRENNDEEERIILSNTLNAYVRDSLYIRDEYQPKQSFTSPWTRCMIIPAEVVKPPDNAPVRSEDGAPIESAWNPAESELVAWAVAMHRMLVRQWGYGASPVLTGRYDAAAIEMIGRPANNVAIHILTKDAPVREDLRPLLPAFLVMMPTDMPFDESDKLAALCEGLRGSRLFYSRESETLRLGAAVEMDAVDLWKPVSDGCERWWTPFPMCIREAFPVRQRRSGGRRWGAREDIALALGHMLRDSIDMPDGTGAGTTGRMTAGERQRSYWDIIDRVTGGDHPDQAQHIRICDAKPVYRTGMHDYVHKTPAGHMLAASTALLAFPAEYGADTTIMAIGQSRHLGGGLLIPVDIASQLIDAATGRPLWTR